MLKNKRNILINDYLCHLWLNWKSLYQLAGISSVVVPVTTNFVSSNPAHGEVYSIQHYCDKVWLWLKAGRWSSLGTPVSSTNKTDHHNITITEIVESGVKHHNPKPDFEVHIQNPTIKLALKVVFLISPYTVYVALSVCLSTCIVL
jgi:hypothetical protein